MSKFLLASVDPLPPDLARHVRRITLLGTEATIEFHPEAARWLEDRRRLAAPGDPEQCHKWMAFLVLGINGVTLSEQEAREISIWAMCQDLPSFVWCQKTIRDVWAKTPFLPGPGLARAVLEEHAQVLLHEIAALEKMAAAIPPPPLQPAPPYVMPPVPEWCFDRSMRKRSALEHLTEPDEVDDCQRPKSNSLAGLIKSINKE